MLLRKSLLLLLLYILFFSATAGNAHNTVVVIPIAKSPEPIGIVESSGQFWMDRNLGATRIATKSNDPESYGDLYQWGRNGDGHQERTSRTTTERSEDDTPIHNKFIEPHDNPRNWRQEDNPNLWQGEAGINNSCPSGFRVPSQTEFEAERQSWSEDSSSGAFASPLKLPTAGYRSGSDGVIKFSGYFGNYWTSNPGMGLVFISDNVSFLAYTEATGMSVRCIKD